MNNIFQKNEYLFEEIIKQKDSGVTCDELIARYPEKKEDILFLFDVEQKLQNAFNVSMDSSYKKNLDEQFLVTKNKQERLVYKEGKEMHVSSPYQHYIINRIQKTLAFGIPVLILLVVVFQTKTFDTITKKQTSLETQRMMTGDTLMDGSSSEKQSSVFSLNTSDSSTGASLVDSYVDSVYQDMETEINFSEDESLDASIINNDIDTITSYNTNFYDIII